jgi:hypothetical protein
MSIHDPRVATTPSSLTLPPYSWRARRRRKHEVAQLVRETEWAVEQAQLQAILSDARRLVEENWIQGAWVATGDDARRSRFGRGGKSAPLADSRIIGSCLVGSIVRASGGLSASSEQALQHALDAVWHALRQPEGADVQWNPSAATRALHLRDLTRWDEFGATSTADVSSLLLTAERVVLFSGE